MAASRRRRERLAVFHSELREDLEHWVATDRAIVLRVLQLAEHVLRNPFEGIGKPEPLRFHMQACWSTWCATTGSTS